MASASRRPIGVLWATLILWGVLLLVVWALATYAHADECNDDLKSDRTLKCQLYKPQHRQCRPDQDLNKDMDLLDNLCGLCPPGQCEQGHDLGTGALVCVPCGGASCAVCDPNPCLNGGHPVATCDGACACLCVGGCTGDLCATCGTTTTTAAPTTTTTELATTTTTSTTTSTTTTTPPPVAHSLTVLYGPDDPYNAVGDNFGADLLLCNEWVPTVGITNAQTIVFNQTTNPNSCGVAIYTADGSTRLYSTGGISCQQDTNVVTSSAFTIDPGTQYQVCRCSATGANFEVGSPVQTGAVAAIENALSVPGSTSAANACTGGSPPATTGALSPHTHAGMVIFLLGTTTP